MNRRLFVAAAMMVGLALAAVGQKASAEDDSSGFEWTGAGWYAILYDPGGWRTDGDGPFAGKDMCVQTAQDLFNMLKQDAGNRAEMAKEEVGVDCVYLPSQPLLSDGVYMELPRDAETAGLRL